jgi:hypothetical protein
MKAAGIGIGQAASVLGVFAASLASVTFAVRKFNEMESARLYEEETRKRNQDTISARSAKLMQMLQTAEDAGQIPRVEADILRNQWRSATAEFQQRSWIESVGKRMGAVGQVGENANRQQALETYNTVANRAKAAAAGEMEAEINSIYEKAGKDLKEAFSVALEAGKDWRPIRDAILAVRDQAIQDVRTKADQKAAAATAAARDQEIAFVRSMAEEEVTIDRLNEQHAERARLLREQATELERQRISQDFRKTGVQKYQELRATGLGETDLGPDPMSTLQNMQAAVVQVYDQIGTVAQNVARGFQDVMMTSINSISDGITGLIVGTQTWGQALQRIGLNILTSIVGAIVQMGVRWVATQLMMAAFGKSLMAASVAATIPFAAASAAIWSAPATLATIASYGGAAAAAPAQIALSQAATAALSIIPREQGGPVQAGQMYLVGEKRPELFVPQSDGYIYPNTSPGMVSAAAGGSGRTQINQTLAAYFDRRKMMEEIGDDLEARIIEVGRRNRFSFSS